MIDIGYKFPHNGAEVLLTAPAQNDGIVILAGYGEGDGREYVTARVYVHQLPHPETWDNGTYDHNVESAVKHFMDRADLARPGYDEPGVKRMVALARNVEKRLDEVPDTSLVRKAALAYLHGDDLSDDAPDLRRLADALGVPHADVEAL